VERHTTTEVLEGCAQALEYLCNEDYAISSRCDLTRNPLIDRIVKKCEQDYENYVTLMAGVRIYLVCNFFSSSYILIHVFL
jgi:cohesin complex subunit SA-1/2